MPAEIVGRDYVEFITRANCPLCDKGEKVLQAAAQRWGVEIRRLDVDADADLLEEFSVRVPVIRTPAGEVIDEGKISKLRTNAGLLRMRSNRFG